MDLRSHPWCRESDGSTSPGGVANGYLYWADQDALGRVRPNGTSPTRHFTALPQQAGGGVADGLATDGRRLCPQQLTVGNDHLYWTELPGFVGRATLHGSGASGTWPAIHTGQGPFNVAADSTRVYWDWGGVADSPMHIGIARVDRSRFNGTHLSGQGALYLTTPGANT